MHLIPLQTQPSTYSLNPNPREVPSWLGSTLLHPSEQWAATRSSGWARGRRGLWGVTGPSFWASTLRGLTWGRVHRHTVLSTSSLLQRGGYWALAPRCDGSGLLGVGYGCYLGLWGLPTPPSCILPGSCPFLMSVTLGNHLPISEPQLPHLKSQGRLGVGDSWLSSPRSGARTTPYPRPTIWPWCGHIWICLDFLTCLGLGPLRSLPSAPCPLTMPSLQKNKANKQTNHPPFQDLDTAELLPGCSTSGSAQYS